jgi:hypothetical protein
MALGCPKPHPPHRPHVPRIRGATLLEAIATIALSGIILSSATTALTAAATELRKQQRAHTALGLARARLEAAIGLPCVLPETCPEPFVCRVEHEVALLPDHQRPFWVIRLHSIVTTQGGPEPVKEFGDGISFTTLVARPTLCPGYQAMNHASSETAAKNPA